MRKGLVFLPLVLLILAAFVLSGCASKTYVDKRFKELDSSKANNAKVEDLNGKVNTLEGKVGEVDRKAGDALKKAQDAYDLANAPMNLQLLGEREVYFDFDKYNLTKKTKEVLDEVGKMMQQRSDLVLEVAGHCDKVGTDSYNLLLGHRRAEAVTRYLNDQYQIDLRKLFLISYGKTKPKAAGETKASESSNRRAVLRILGIPEK
jgi:peptidoglycan-associated lipoprotein